VSITANGVRLYYSQDEGDTWVAFTATSGPGFPLGADPFQSGDTGTEWEPDSATVSCGRTIMIGNSTDGGGGTTYDGMVWACQLGGWTNLEFQGWHDGGGGSDGLTWLPVELPTTIAAWVESTTGGTATLISPGAMQVVTGAGQRLHWIDTIDTNARDIVVLLDLDVQSGGSLTSNQIGAGIFLGNGTSRTDVEINFTTTQYSVFDRHAATSRGTFTPTAGRVQVLVYHTWANGTPTVSTWHRTAGGRSAQLPLWTGR
jgi:hypothetical protein